MERPGLPAVKMRRMRTAASRLIERYKHRASLAAGAALIAAWIAMAAGVMLALRWGSR